MHKMIKNLNKEKLVDSIPLNIMLYNSLLKKDIITIIIILIVLAATYEPKPNNKVNAVFLLLKLKPFMIPK